ncbi:MAG: hypothetical protein JWM71_1291 [Solirubrobacteraceae bacterium]|nr:hypothetical protein [Solirubrobacteraceae bacterium]
MSGWQRVHLDDIPAIDGPDSLTWRPVRRTLDLRAFGTNAYTAQEAGADVVEPHDEDPGLAHEELYFVHAGSARFTLDGESFDAPAGTYVRVTDPAIHRHAVALEPGTTVLSFGGPRTFTPSPWEHGWAANATEDVQEARAMIDAGLADWPDSAALPYWRAKIELRAGDEAAAREWLASALEREPRLRDEARGEADLAALLDG